MVFFTCNHCGAALKKNRVEKHYTTECRSSPAVSCMDCSKDFFGEDFKSHTRCISESQKYSGKPVDNNDMLGKGEKKQLEWVETVRNIVETKGSTLTPQERQLLESLKDFENIPRKKKKFENFLKNVARRYVDSITIDKVWAMLEEHKPVAGNKRTDVKNDAKEEPEAILVDGDLQQEEKKSKKKNKKGQEKVEEQLNGEEVAAVCAEDANSKKKKKKRKSSTGNGDVTINEDVDEEISQSGKGKKLSNQDKVSPDEENSTPNGQGSDATQEAVVNGGGKNEQNVSKLSKKEKKEKKKKQKYESELESISKEVALDGDALLVQVDMEIDDGKTEELEKGRKSKKNKKQKNKEKTGVETVEDEGSVVGSDGTKGKDKKKGKRKNNGDLEEDCGSKKKAKKGDDVVQEEEKDRLKGINGGIVENEKPKGKFKWDKIILSILQSVPDKELPVKRLRKKVLAEYEESLMSGSSRESSLEEALGMFERKLHKIPGVKVLKEKAKLVSSG